MEAPQAAPAPEKKVEETKKEDTANKACSACKASVGKDGYSKAQWAKPADSRKCKTCIEKSEGGSPAPKPAAAGAAPAAAGASGQPTPGDVDFVQHIRLLSN